MPSRASWASENWRSDPESDTLVAMRASCLILVLLASCGNDADPPAAPGGGSDPTIVGSGTRSVGGTGSGGTGGEAGAGGDGGSASAACANDFDIAALDASLEARELVRECLVFSFFACRSALNPEIYESCVTECVLDRVEGLSNDCGRCFGRASRCELENTCDTACVLNICSEGCLSCSRGAGCLDELEECTGLNDTSCSI